MLKDHPKGKIVTFDVGGFVLSSTDESSISGSSEPLGSSEMPKRSGRAKRGDQISKALRAMLPNARSVAFVPFWDYERARQVTHLNPHVRITY